MKPLRQPRHTQGDKDGIVIPVGDEDPPPGLAAALEKAGLSGVRLVGSSDLDADDLHFGYTGIGLTSDRLIVCSPNHGKHEVLLQVPLNTIRRVKLEDNGETVEFVVEGEGEATRVAGTRKARRALQRATEEVNEALGRKDPPRAVPRCTQCGKETSVGRLCLDCVDKKALLVRLFSYLGHWPESGLFAATTLLLALLTACSLASPWMFKLLIDQVVPHKDWRLMASLIAAMAGLRVGSIGFGTLRTYWMTLLGQRVTLRFKAETFAHVMKLSLGFFQKKSPGDIIYRINSDIGRLQDFMTGWAQDLLRQAAQVVMIAVLLFHLSPTMAWFVLIPVPLITLGAMMFGQRISRSYMSVWHLGSRLTSRVADVIPGMRMVKTCGKEADECATFQGLAEGYVSATMSATGRSCRFYPSLSSLTAAVELGLLFWGVTLIFRGRMEVGSMIAFLSYMGQFYEPVHGLVRVNDRLVQAYTSAVRVFEVLDEESEVEERPDAVDLEMDQVQGRIEFRNVTFGYDPEHPVVQNLSFTVEPGQSLGLVGKSGCGKSTLLALLLRAYDPQEGQILLDDIDLRDVKLNSLMRVFGVVLQEPFLFQGTVFENLTYGNPGASELDVVRAAKAAGAHDFIMEFPDAYDHMIGAGGAGLSGGQRQRLAIARALLRDPKVLILDEATSALDSETEAQISANMQNLIRGRTTFAVAHRLSTLERMDAIMVLEGGRIVEHGPAGDLRQRGGPFAQLSRLQGKPDPGAQPSPQDLEVKPLCEVEVRLEPTGYLEVRTGGRQLSHCFAQPTLPFSAESRCLVEIRRQDENTKKTEGVTLVAPTPAFCPAQAAVAENLRRRRFIPRILRVIRVSQKAVTELHVETERGSARIQVAGSSAVQRYDRAVVLTDLSGARFRLDSESLDRRSRELLAGLV